MKRWVAAAIFIGLVLTGLVALGNWQTRRADEKDALLREYAAGRDAEPILVSDVDQLAVLPRFTRVRLSGRFDSEHLVFLENQVDQGRPGVHVLVPLRLTEGEAVLVNLGWLAFADRTQLPTAVLPEDGSPVTGLVNHPPRVGVQLGETAAGSWPLLTPYLELGGLGEVLGYALAPRVIWADPEADSPYRREWRITDMPPARHRAYAFQWYSLALGFALLCGFLAYKVRQERQ